MSVALVVAACYSAHPSLALPCADTRAINIPGRARLW
jgi:hypothetical protein